MHKTYKHKKIEEKWNKRWKKEKLHKIDLTNSKKPFYNLMMFPYPSSEGLHIGNMYAFTGADIFGRYYSMLGYDVFEPIGLDGFGIHSENYAIKIGKHPKEHAKESEENFYKQLYAIGNMFAWEHRLETYDSDYYKWTQWLFVKMFKEGLAYRDFAWVNWCPSCATVLADEQVESGQCERCGSRVERKQMQSWFFRITKYASRLLDNIEGASDKKSKNKKLAPVGDNYDPKLQGLRWPKKIKIAQKRWIGKKEGTVVYFKIKKTSEKLGIFTTRLDTIYGTTFIVLSPEVAKKYLDITGNKEKVTEYIKSALNKTEQERKLEEKTKSGLNTGIVAVNPANDEELPVFVADYVLVDVGTGAVMGVPAHDVRDYEFAKKNDLPIKQVIHPVKGKHDFTKGAFTQDGELVNSGKYSGLKSKAARKNMLQDFSNKKYANKQTTYHLRDWLISRQRYWGPPIPMIYCKKCGKKGIGEKEEMPGWFSVDEEDLPVALPDIDGFEAKSKQGTPLENAPEEWKKVDCPSCGGDARRELEVSDTFLDSSWYFLAYPHIRNGNWERFEDTKENEPFSDDILEKWLPVNAYIGGAEHAVLHLLYSRFVTMALSDMGYVNFEEPFPFLYAHGLIIKEGSKMSKSKGNIITPDEYIDKFGADVFRMYLMFLGPYSQGGNFQDTGIEGMRRFFDRVWDLYDNHSKMTFVDEKVSSEIFIKTHHTIKKVTKDIQEFKYNTAISSMMEFINYLRELVRDGGVEEIGEKNVVSLEWERALSAFAQLLAPFAPFFAEELWNEKIGKTFSVHTSGWPKFNPELLKEMNVTLAIQVDGKLRATIDMDRELALDKKGVVKLAKNHKNVSKWIKNTDIKDEIFVSGKLLNFVTK